MALTKSAYARLKALLWSSVLTMLLVFGAQGRAQTRYPDFVRGFLTVNVPAGDSVLASPFEAPTNTVAALFPNAGNGCRVFKFDPVVAGFLATTKILGAWSAPEMTLVPGEAFIFRAPAATAIAFAGWIEQGILSTPIAVGTNLLGSQVAQSGLLSTDLGFPAVSGDTVLLVEGSNTNVFTFSAGVWSPSEPVLGVGRGFELRTTQARTWSRTFSIQGNYQSFPYPVIHTQPTGRIVGVGGPATFSVGASAASSIGPLSYQWRRNGVVIPGATSASFTVAAAQTDNSGDYDVLVSGSTGAGYSTVASLAVSSQIAPAGTASLGFITVNGSLSNPIFDSDGVTKLSGSAGWVAQIYAGITADETSFGNYADPIGFSSGAQAGFVIGEQQNGFPGFGGQQLFVQIRVWNTFNGGSYEAASAVAGSKVGKSSVFALTAGGTPQGGGVAVPSPNVDGFASFALAVTTSVGVPLINVQPTPVSVVVGGTTSFNVTAAGAPPLTYQWRSNSVSIAAATNASFTLTNVQSSFAASYSVVVTNAYGSITSAPAVLTVSDNVLVFTLAGSGGQGSADGSGASASFRTPHGVAVDSAGNVYVADTGNNLIRKVTRSGLVSTLAGGGGAAGSFTEPGGVAVDLAGNAYVADAGNNQIRKVTPGGLVSTLAGSGAYGSDDGPGYVAKFGIPYGVAVDSAGNVYVADTGNYKIRKVTPGGLVSTLAGSGTSGSADGSGDVARFEISYGIAVDSSSNIYLADTRNNKIRKVTPGGLVSTLAGSGTPGSADGPSDVARFSQPYDLAVDSSGNVYVVDTGNNKIRKVTPGGLVSTLAGGGTQGSTDGPGASASFAYPYGVAVDSAGNLYVADTSNHKIRKILVNDVAPTVIGMAEGQTVVRGTNVAWSIAAFSLSPMGFQWYSNSVPIVGATGANLALGAAQLNWSGTTYSVVVTNAVGATTNSVALTVEEFGTPHISVTGAVPGGGNVFGGSATVTITSAFPTTTIFYSLDGSTPTTSGPLTYTGAFTVTSNVTVRALAVNLANFSSVAGMPMAITIVPIYSLNLSTAGGGTVGKAPDSSTYLSNSVVTITATPDAGWSFLHWTGDTNGLGGSTMSASGATNTLTMDRARNVQAVFGTTVTGSAPLGGGVVEVSPAGGVYAYGSVVRLTARPEAGRYFNLWGGHASGTNNPLSVTVTQPNRTNSALFSTLQAGQVTLDVQVNGNGTVTVNPLKNVYNVNEVVTLTATPATVMERFTGWSGASTATTNVIAVTLDSSKTLTANFGPVLPGTVVAWGSNAYGQLDVPVGLSGVITIASGLRHSLAVKADGAVVAWGYNSNGQTNAPPNLSGVVAVAGGLNHSLALKDDGTVVAWGDFGVVPPNLIGVVAIAGGLKHSLALKGDGTVVAWGSSDSFGETVVPIGLTGVVAIAAGWSHSLALKNDGKVVAWGWNASGQASVPSNLTEVVAISGSWQNSLAVRRDGTVVQWGGTPITSVPLDLAGVLAVRAGAWNGLALKWDGTVAAWGDSNFYQQSVVPLGLREVVAIESGEVSNTALVGNASGGAKPKLLTQPVNRTVAVGNNAVFGVAAVDGTHAGRAPQMTYQWRSNSAPILGATNAWLAVTNVQPMFAAGYSVVITNAHGAVTSSVAALTVLLPQTITFPQITNSVLGAAPFSLNATSDSLLPVNYTVVSGPASVSSNLLTLTGGGTVTVRASQPGNSNYLAAVDVQRSFEVLVTLTTPVVGGGTVSRSLDLPGYTNNTTVQLTALPNAGGVFLGWVGDAGGTQNPLSVQLSTNKTVTARFGTPPSITVQPVGAALVVSNVVSLDVSAIGTAPFAYQWSKDGGALLGATNASFTLAQVRTNDAGSYRVVITNAAGSVTSNPALLTVDRLGQTITFDPLVSVRADAAPFSLGASASSRLAVVYTSADTNVAVVSAGGVGIRGVGTTVITATQEGNESYAPAAAVGRTLTVTPVPASIVSVPTNRIFTAGQNASLTVVAAGIPRAFQWYKDGVPVAGATGSTMAFGRARPEHAGMYSVVVSNSLGSVTSSPPAVVSVLQDATAGTVIAWGSNQFGQSNVPPAAMSGVVAVAAGNAHTVALKGEGAVMAWGWNQEMQTNIPVTAQSGVVAVAAGYAHTVALKGDGSVVAWGWDGSGQATVPLAAQAGVIAVAAGGAHSLALKSDGSVVAWGENSFSQTNVPPAAQSAVVAVVAGDDNSLALRRDGSVVAWGGNLFGQSTVPAEAMSDVVAVSTGDGHVAVLKSDGSIFAWGNNQFGQTNVPPSAQSGVVSVASGDIHTMALKSDGSVVAWGFNGSGRTNVPPMAGSNVFGIAAGGSHSVALVRLPPAITSGPTNLLVGEHEDATFSVSASGASPFYYQWFQGAVPLPGRTNAILVLTNVGVAQVGSYTVTVSNALGSVTSSPALLTVNRLGQMITFDALPNRILGDAPFDLSASASSGLPVQFNLVSGPASLSGNRLTLSNQSGGRVAVRASQPGNSNYLAAADVERSFEVLVTLGTSVTGVGSVNQVPTGSAFTNGTEVTITATPGAGHAFVGWTGSVTNSNNPLPVLMETNKQVTANFLPVYSLTVSNSAGGLVTLLPATGPYVSNTVVQATAVASNGFAFVSWQGTDTNAGANATVTMSSNRTVGATFLPFRTLTTSVVGGGSILQTPAGTSFTNGTVVTLTAVTNPGTFFLGWSGTSNTLLNPLPLVMDGNKTLIATFQNDTVPPLVTVTNTVPAVVTNENLTLAGTIYENDGVKSASWRLNDGSLMSIDVSKPHFLIDLKLNKDGPNQVELLAEDHAGNRSTNVITVAWQPSRKLALVPLLPAGPLQPGDMLSVQEGARARFVVTLESGGEIAGIEFRVAYDPLRLKDPRVVFFLGSDPSATDVPGSGTNELRFALRAAVPAGSVQLCALEFTSLSVPRPRESQLPIFEMKMSDRLGNQIIKGSLAVGGVVEIRQRTLLGDVDGTGTIGAGDLPPLMTLITSTNRQPWDETLNDLNGTGGFEIADVVLAARIANRATPPIPVRTAQSVRSRKPQALMPQSTTLEAGNGVLEVEPVWQTNKFVAVISLRGNTNNVYAVALRCRYPSNQLTHLGESMGVTFGAMVPATNRSTEFASFADGINLLIYGTNAWSASNGELLRLAFSVPAGAPNTEFPFEVEGELVPSIDGGEVSMTRGRVALRFEAGTVSRALPIQLSSPIRGSGNTFLVPLTRSDFTQFSSARTNWFEVWVSTNLASPTNWVLWPNPPLRQVNGEMVLEDSTAAGVSHKFIRIIER